MNHKISPKSDQVKAPHILVIDDDPLFRAKVRRIAEQRDINVTVCGSLRETDAMAKCHLFDVAVVDYYLDDIKGHLRGTDIANVFESTPVILISNTNGAISNNSAFPNSVRQFMNKGVGINAILNEAMRVAGPTPRRARKLNEKGQVLL